MALLCLPWGKLEAQGAWDVAYLHLGYYDQHKLTLLGYNKDGVQLWFSDYPYTDKTASSSIYTSDSTYLYYNFRWANPEQYHVKDLYLNPDNGFSTSDDIYKTVLGKAYHFYASVGSFNLLYAGYSLTEDKWGYQTPGFSFFLAPHTTLTASEPFINQSQGVYTQQLKWNIDNLTDSAITQVTIMASYNGGESWTPIHTSTKGCDSTTTTLPWTLEKVRYYAVATKQERFSMLFDGDTGLTSEQTPDFTLQPADIPCTFAVNSTATFNDADCYGDRTYTTLVLWNVPCAQTATFESVYLQYTTTENTNQWHTILQCNKAYGAEYISLPVGYSNYIYRLIVKSPKDTPSLHDSTIVVRHNTKAYNAQFASLSIKGTLNESYNAETDSITPTIQYLMNDDLYQIRNSPAQISYSIDDGQTWQLLTTIDNPQQSGEAQLKLPSTGNEYLFRIRCGTMVDNILGTEVDFTSTAYPFTKVIHLNDTKDYTPIQQRDAKVILNRSYTAGKLGTICLPFDLNQAQATEGFGSGAKVYTFDKITGSTMHFKQVSGGIMGGVAHIVRTATDIDSLVFTGVNIDTVAINETFPLTWQNEQGESYTLAGTFSPYTMKTDGTELYITADGKAKTPSTSGNRMKGYRAYIILPSASSEVKLNIDGELTSIEDICPTPSSQHEDVYNTNGQLISHSTDHLPKGIYIVGGKKLVIP